MRQHIAELNEAQRQDYRRLIQQRYRSADALALVCAGARLVRAPSAKELEARQ